MFISRHTACLLSIFIFANANSVMRAQFNTIEKKPKLHYVIMPREPVSDIDMKEVVSDSIKLSVDTKVEKDTTSYRTVREKAKAKSRERNILKRSPKDNKAKDLTIAGLYEEILKNNIQHPKIVLAQAILETGWFTSSVCRNKGNLFGLTNPRTGTYYEFNDWRESVKAYYDLVQYRYKGGNYLLWLKKIGYAEDPRYITSLIEVIEKHILRP